MTEYNPEKGESKENTIRFFGSIIFLCMTSSYFFMSSIPHSWANLKAVGFNDFKNGSLSQEEGIFSAHPDYFTILADLNIESQQKVFDTTFSKIENIALKKIVDNNLDGERNIKKLQQILSQIMKIDLTKTGLSQGEILSLQTEARTIL